MHDRQCPSLPHQSCCPTPTKALASASSLSCCPLPLARRPHGAQDVRHHQAAQLRALHVPAGSGAGHGPRTRQVSTQGRPPVLPAVVCCCVPAAGWPSGLLLFLLLLLPAWLWSKLVGCLPGMLTKTSSLLLAPARYTRASFLFPEQQPAPHTSFDQASRAVCCVVVTAPAGGGAAQAGWPLCRSSPPQAGEALHSPAMLKQLCACPRWPSTAPKPRQPACHPNPPAPACLHDFTLPSPSSLPLFLSCTGVRGPEVHLCGPGLLLRVRAGRRPQRLAVARVCGGHRERARHRREAALHPGGALRRLLGTLFLYPFRHFL